jgi:hypothetical protein
MTIPGLDARGITPEFKPKTEILLFLNLVFLLCFLLLSSFFFFLSFFLLFSSSSSFLLPSSSPPPPSFSVKTEDFFQTFK